MVDTVVYEHRSVQSESKDSGSQELTLPIALRSPVSSGLAMQRGKPANWDIKELSFVLDLSPRADSLLTGCPGGVPQMQESHDKDHGRLSNNV